MFILLVKAAISCLVVTLLCAVVVWISVKSRSRYAKRSDKKHDITPLAIERLLITTAVFFAILIAGLAILLILDARGWLSPADTGLSNLPFPFQIPILLLLECAAVFGLLMLANRAFSPALRYWNSLGHVLATRLLSILGAVVVIVTCFLVGKSIFADFREFPERALNITVRSAAGVLQRHSAVQFDVDENNDGVLIELDSGESGYVLTRKAVSGPTGVVSFRA